MYSHSDLREVVRYAWERGIRVVPEWEMPGHAYGFVALLLSLSALAPIGS
mgnify:CR=1 FL=1